ncbi:prokaryotic E2 ligase family D protein [Mongoliitalea daihaiensis]|uniref:prokaryotic E2 ligase family D protein n=1 Tax=Mongoliitalea daihaiensis TaxID=2782006 RepID=UPI001F293D93|nr:prokaryotic E2 ligase family D protein [Mongoliitalea daihaiensis]UJP64046.1 hypothetical protein IPZ59_14630 [Mongoliitalea daihaiensis]
MQPVKGIIFYHNKGNSMSYAETHRISYSEEKKAFIAVDKRPMKISDLEMIHDIVQKSTTRKESFSTYTEKILAVDWLSLYRGGIRKETLKMVWYTEPQAFKFFFPKGFVPGSGMYNMPYLVWHYIKGKLSVYATKEKPSLFRKTQLFHAPLLNVYEKGNVCMGSTKIELSNSQFLDEIALDITKGFFMSEFNHLHTTISMGTSYQSMYEYCQTNPFDNDHLVQINETLENLCTL